MGGRYRIGQAAKRLGLAPSVLRYWESEFPQLEPVRTRKGQRLYTDEHLALLERIQAMLHGEGLTIEGARRRLEQELAAQARAEAAGTPAPQGGAGDPGGADGPGNAEAPGAPGDAGSPGGTGSADTTLKRTLVEELLALRRLLRD
ncbi:MerR family transcriptional regulator [Desulfocurvus vexinensis]|uniref:MerR family transcriptional regulator n=1 Tax=Desulfocurvus vexinensis TaxID=399548 RepID=UPI00048D6CBD|nr:MerR family transcriptional regulator [Desulfocurvus vexinensis]